MMPIYISNAEHNEDDTPRPSNTPSIEPAYSSGSCGATCGQQVLDLMKKHKKEIQSRMAKNHRGFYEMLEKTRSQERNTVNPAKNTAVRKGQSLGNVERYHDAAVHDEEQGSPHIAKISLVPMADDTMQESRRQNQNPENNPQTIHAQDQQIHPHSPQAIRAQKQETHPHSPRAIHAQNQEIHPHSHRTTHAQDQEIRSHNPRTIQAQDQQIHPHSPRAIHAQNQQIHPHSPRTTQDQEIRSHNPRTIHAQNQHIHPHSPQQAIRAQNQRTQPPNVESDEYFDIPNNFNAHNAHYDPLFHSGKPPADFGNPRPVPTAVANHRHGVTPTKQPTANDNIIYEPDEASDLDNCCNNNHPTYSTRVQFKLTPSNSDIPTHRQHERYFDYDHSTEEPFYDVEANPQGIRHSPHQEYGQTREEELYYRGTKNRSLNGQQGADDLSFSSSEDEAMVSTRKVDITIVPPTTGHGLWCFMQDNLVYMGITAFLIMIVGVGFWVVHNNSSGDEESFLQPKEYFGPIM